MKTIKLTGVAVAVGLLMPVAMLTENAGAVTTQTDLMAAIAAAQSAVTAIEGKPEMAAHKRYLSNLITKANIVLVDFEDKTASELEDLVPALREGAEGVLLKAGLAKTAASKAATQKITEPVNSAGASSMIKTTTAAPVAAELTAVQPLASQVKLAVQTEEAKPVELAAAGTGIKISVTVVNPNDAKVENDESLKSDDAEEAKTISAEQVATTASVGATGALTVLGAGAVTGMTEKKRRA